MLEEGLPLLQENQSFEETVSRVIREDPLDRQLISNLPQGPTLGSKENPKASFIFPRELQKDGDALSQG